MNQNSFSNLDLRPELLQSLEKLDYQEMTPIQAQSLPTILKGQDIIGQGKTGSGKTAAFGLGVLQCLVAELMEIQVLVLCPTRELSDQVAKVLRNLAKSIANVKILTLCGGSPMRGQMASLEHGAHIIVGTPGRIEDHLQKGTLKLSRVNTLVLDEADRMLDMGFQPSVEYIVKKLPRKRQNLLFSATFPDEIKHIADSIMTSPIHIKVEATHGMDVIQQHFYKVKDDHHRFTALRLVLLEYKPNSVVVFCTTKVETQKVADELNRYKFKAIALHGDIEQQGRDEALVQFANKSVSVLVATDVAARGLDIDSIDMVVNYHLSKNSEIHTHRIGRTGRAGSKGIACSFFSTKEKFKLDRLEEHLKKKIQASDLPPINTLNETPATSPMKTMVISGGKKQKIRPGDILGALTSQGGVPGDAVGKIHIYDNRSYVAIHKDSVKIALNKLKNGKLKGRIFKANQL